MWKKSWQECRFRFWLCLGVVAAFGAIGLAPIPDIAGAGGAWTAYSRLMLPFLAMITVVNLAGSGVNSQSKWGMFHGFHPSMYFLLSLPVSRRSALLKRAAMGMGLTVVLIALAAVSYGALAPLKGVTVPAGAVVPAVVYISFFAYAVFGLATLLTTLFDEVVSGVLGFAAAGAILGAGAMATGHRPLAFIAGETFYRTGSVGWLGLLLLIAVGTLLMAAAIYVVERKEY